MSDLLQSMMNPGVLALLIPIVAILGFAINKGLKAHYAHQERMAKIENGLDPNTD